MEWNFPVRPQKIAALRARFEALAIQGADLEEKFVRGSGKGGQKVNKTNNCVQLSHRPSGIVIQCHRERDRSLNRYVARVMLADAIERQSSGGHTEKERAKIEKIRKQKSRRRRRKKGSPTQGDSGSMPSEEP
jgi:protein subunit release factor B